MLIVVAGERSPVDTVALPVFHRGDATASSQSEFYRCHTMINQSRERKIDKYVAAFPPEVQAILQTIRSIIRKAAPKAEEKISYKMPAFRFGGRDLIYFAAFKKHIGIFPPVRGDEKLNRDLAPYRGQKDSLKFPLNEPIPYALIGRVVKFRVKEHLQKLASKRSKR